MEAKEAIELLQNRAAVELEKVQKEGAAYFARGDMAHVREVADRVDEIQAILNCIHQFQEQWQRVFPEAAEPVVITHRVMEHSYPRTPAGQKTPQECYWLPILQALSEHRGSGRTKIILNRVGTIMADILNDWDYQNLPGRREIIWRNTAAWARADMVREGYLSSESPTGIWEITEEGRKYLKNRSPR